MLLLENKYIIDTKSSAAQNKFTYSIRYKGDGSSKAKGLASKLEKKEELYQSKIVPEFEAAKNEYDKILNSNGTDLLSYWGNLGKDLDNEDILSAIKQSPKSSEPNYLKKDKKSKTVRASDVHNCKLI